MNKPKLDLLEKIYYRLLDGTEGAPIDAEEYHALEAEASRREKILLEHLSEEGKKLFYDYDDAMTLVEARMHYYSFKQGVKFCRDVEKTLDDKLLSKCE